MFLYVYRSVDSFERKLEHCYNRLGTPTKDQIGVVYQTESFWQREFLS
jgi:hypothetical protein